MDLCKYRMGTRYITNVGFSTLYNLDEILVDSSSTHLYWKILNWIYAPLIEKRCVDLLSIRDSCGCWVRDLMSDLRIGLWLLFHLRMHVYVGLLVAYPTLIWIWTVMWLGNRLIYYRGYDLSVLIVDYCAASHSL